MLLLAMEALADNRLDDVRFWAARADNEWRRVVADLPALDALFRSDLARLRARTAWKDWSDDERKHERASWKKLAGSR